MSRTSGCTTPWWPATVLEHQGLHPDPELQTTHVRRSVLAHVFPHGRNPLEELWCKPAGDTMVDLIAEGHIDDTGRELTLTDEGPAAAGVLWPRVR
ncbi:hypothetical protein [Kocuria nitroreducens]|uniref:hypothetical protein n=1 Tax=Kocuria nitroreducens TaxID=3058914 RepID=UPI0036D9ADE8